MKHGISHEDAEEAIQETLVDLVKIMPSYKYDKARNGAFHSLLFKIAQNKAVDRMRKAKADADKTATKSSSHSMNRIGSARAGR